MELIVTNLDEAYKGSPALMQNYFLQVIIEETET